MNKYICMLATVLALLAANFLFEFFTIKNYTRAFDETLAQAIALFLFTHFFVKKCEGT